MRHDPMKRCSKCGGLFKMTEEFFCRDSRASDSLSSWCLGCKKEYRDEHKGESRQYYIDHKEELKTRGKKYADIHKVEKSAYDKKYNATHKAEKSAYDKEYHASVGGHLRRIYGGQKWRCSNKKSYIEKGIKNKFESSEQFIGYVVEVLKVDPRGLDCHRIDNDRHYEPGNIEFLTSTEHRAIHKGAPC